MVLLALLTGSTLCGGIPLCTSRYSRSDPTDPCPPSPRHLTSTTRSPVRAPGGCCSGGVRPGTTRARRRPRVRRYRRQAHRHLECGSAGAGSSADSSLIRLDLIPLDLIPRSAHGHRACSDGVRLHCADPDRRQQCCSDLSPALDDRSRHAVRLRGDCPDALRLGGEQRGCRDGWSHGWDRAGDRRPPDVGAHSRAVGCVDAQRLTSARGDRNRIPWLVRGRRASR